MNIFRGGWADRAGVQGRPRSAGNSRLPDQEVHWQPGGVGGDEAAVVLRVGNPLQADVAG